jgi:hypothetical protein
MRISQEKICECWRKDDFEWLFYATREQVVSLVNSNKLPQAALVEWQDFKNYTVVSYEDGVLNLRKRK